MKRYDLVFEEMLEETEGDWVKFEDFQKSLDAIRDKFTELEAKMLELEKSLNGTTYENQR